MTIEGRDSFNFQTGNWQVHHRKLRERLVGCSEWYEFAGTCSAWPILGGAGNVEDNWLDDPNGAYSAAAVRKFDPATGQWSIWWVDARQFDLDPPVHGRFIDGIGTFNGSATLAGAAIEVRFIWSDTAGNTPKWEQAFSADGGKTWETNWTMLFTRTG